jgi:hypothetical protein
MEDEINSKININKITWENYGSKLLNIKNKYSFTNQEIENLKKLLSKKEPSLENRRKVKININ